MFHLFLSIQECAGFLTAVGFDVTVMVRSILLRGFDQDMAKRIGAYMGKNNTKFLMEYIPVTAEVLENNQIRVGYRKTNGPETDILCDTFDTVMIATGRYPDTKALNLEAIGVKIDKSGKIIVNEAEGTNIPNIFAIGDCALGRPELTPPAIMVYFIFIFMFEKNFH
jgi:thioredoxin reductase (NADPH)